MLRLCLMRQYLAVRLPVGVIRVKYFPMVRSSDIGSWMQRKVYVSMKNRLEVKKDCCSLRKIEKDMFGSLLLNLM